MSAADRARVQLALDAAAAGNADRARRAAGIPVGQDPAHEAAKDRVMDSHRQATEAGVSEAEQEQIRRRALYGA